MSNANDSTSGFTLVELIITIAVGSILILGLNSIVVSQSYLGQRARDIVMANSFVEGKIEELRSVGFLGLTDGTTDITSELPEELNAPRNGSVVISEHTAAIKKVYISLSYSEQGQTRTLTYSTLIGELGVGQY